MTHLEPVPAVTLDRVRELSSIGAGHAANALGSLLERPCRMRVPLVRVLHAAQLDAPFVEGGEGGPLSGVFFEVQGGLGGVLAILFSARTRKLLVDQLLGRSHPEASPEVRDSALREFGNILVSHVASALADTLGMAVLPSVPLLVDTDAPGALATLVAPRAGEHPVVRVEAEIGDREGAIRSLLVFVPDHESVIAGPDPL